MTQAVGRYSKNLEVFHCKLGDKTGDWGALLSEKKVRESLVQFSDP